MQQKIYYHGQNNTPLTKQQQAEVYRELNNMQIQRMREFAKMLENDPRLVAQATGFKYEGAKFDLAELEERVHLPLHTLFTERGRDPADQLSPTFRHGGTVRGVVHRYPLASDNLPKSDLLVNSEQMKLNRENVHLSHDGMSGDDWYYAVAMALTGTPVSAIPTTIDSIHADENVTAKSKTSGRKLRTTSVWSSEHRDRAATSAPVRKKLRTKTRAQKKARRKQR